MGLSLSTARPSLAAVLPELDAWYLNVYTPPPPIRVPQPAAPRPMFSMAKKMDEQAHLPNQQAMPMYDGLVASSVSAISDEAVVEPQPILPVAANVATATVEPTGTALIFRVGRSVDIPSDNSPHKTTIARDNLPCTFDYVSAPVIEEQVHLRATIINTTERVLLSGDASIFLSGEYVGTTTVKTTAPTEKFKIFLGIDDGIKVKRELIERSVDKGGPLQGSIPIPFR